MIWGVGKGVGRIQTSWEGVGMDTDWLKGGGKEYSLVERREWERGGKGAYALISKRGSTTTRLDSPKAHIAPGFPPPRRPASTPPRTRTAGRSTGGKDLRR